MFRRFTFVGMASLGVLILMGGSAYAQTVDEFPKRDDPLHVRVDLFDKLMRGNHWNEGTMMQHVIFPPAGKETPIVGSQEDCAFHTGGYLAALSYRYAVTQDPEVRMWADQTMAGILKLEAVTGLPGCVARSFNKTDASNWHEKAYFFPEEWHASTALEGYRWLGDLSVDQFTGLIYGVGVYWELCADEAHKAQAADFVSRVVGRCVEYNFRIVDVDNKMTLWGNFCPDLPHENLNALLILSHLKTAQRMTESPLTRSLTRGGAVFQAGYQRLITKYKYDDEAILAKVLWPAEWRNGSDDMLAAMAFYPLLRFEENRDQLIKYRMSLNRHWFVWKDGDNVFYPMLYQVLTGEPVVDEKVVEKIKNLWGFERKRGRWTIPTPDGLKEVEAEEEGNAVWMLHHYWFGRYYGFIDAAW